MDEWASDCALNIKNKLLAWIDSTASITETILLCVGVSGGTCETQMEDLASVRKGKETF